MSSPKDYIENAVVGGISTGVAGTLGAIAIGSGLAVVLASAFAFTAVGAAGALIATAVHDDLVGEKISFGGNDATTADENAGADLAEETHDTATVDCEGGVDAVVYTDDEDNLYLAFCEPATVDDESSKNGDFRTSENDATQPSEDTSSVDDDDL